MMRSMDTASAGRPRLAAIAAPRTIAAMAAIARARVDMRFE